MTAQPVPVVGFVGTGHIATFHSKMLRHAVLREGSIEIERGGVFDIVPERAAEFARASGGTVMGSAREVVEASDMVYICAWTSAHADLVDMCIAHDTPFFCEKPLSVDFDSAARMTAAALASGLTHQCGLVLRRSPAYLMARELITDAAAGAPMAVVFRDDQFIPIQGHYRSTWRADVDKAGAGTLLEHSIHDVDMLRFLIGDVDTVSARATFRHGLPGIDDAVAASIGFSNGAVGTLTTVWHDNLSRPSLRHVEVFCERRTVVIEGDDWFGPVHWSNADGTTGSLAGDELVARTTALAEGDANPDAAFVRAVIDGTPGHPDFGVALEAHRVVEAMYRSAGAEGSSIPVATVTACG